MIKRRAQCNCSLDVRTNGKLGNFARSGPPPPSTRSSRSFHPSVGSSVWLRRQRIRPANLNVVVPARGRFLLSIIYSFFFPHDLLAHEQSRRNNRARERTGHLVNEAPSLTTSSSSSCFFSLRPPLLLIDTNKSLSSCRVEAFDFMRSTKSHCVIRRPLLVSTSRFARKAGEESPRPRGFEKAKGARGNTRSCEGPNAHHVRVCVHAHIGGPAVAAASPDRARHLRTAKNN